MASSKNVRKLDFAERNKSKAEKLDSKIKNFIDKEVFIKETHTELRNFVNALTGIREKSEIAF